MASVSEQRITEEEKTFRENFKRELGRGGIATRPLLCTVCNINIRHRLVTYRNEHSSLGVLVCNSCSHRIRSTTSRDPTDKNLCHWCMNDNTTFNVSCNQCPRKFCRKCTMKHIPRKHKMECWTCFVCNPKQLWHLRVLCSETINWNESSKAELERRKNRSSGVRQRLNNSASMLVGLRPLRFSTPISGQAQSTLNNSIHTPVSVISQPKETKRSSALGIEGRENSNEFGISSKQEQKNKKSESTCVICMEAESQLACVPCGHLCLCESCFPEFKSNFSRCPICRQVYINTLRIYSQL